MPSPYQDHLLTLLDGSTMTVHISCAGWSPHSVSKGCVFATETSQNKVMKGSQSSWAKSQSSFLDVPVLAWVRKKEAGPQTGAATEEMSLVSRHKALRSHCPQNWIAFGSLLQFSLVQHEKFESEVDLWSLSVLCPSSQDEESNGRIVWRMRLTNAWCVHPVSAPELS